MRDQDWCMTRTNRSRVLNPKPSTLNPELSTPNPVCLEPEAEQKTEDNALSEKVYSALKKQE